MPQTSQAIVLFLALSSPILLHAANPAPDETLAASRIQASPIEASPIQASVVQGSVLDTTGAAIPGAAISLTTPQEPNSIFKEAKTDGAGVFVLDGLPPGAYNLVVSAPGFAPQTRSLTATAGQTTDLGQITLLVAALRSTVQVTPSLPEIAAEQLQLEEQQRLFAVVPNFLVTYQKNAAPLNTQQKFQLVFKLVSDPASFGIAGLIAGIEQANNTYRGYGQGAAGFGLRYGAAYGNFFVGNVLGSALLPSLLKQDPRYFVKGDGSVKRRVLYALANSVIRKGDNGHWQPDYSGILGNLAAGGIANAYYPASDRNGAATTFQNAAIGIAAGAAANLFQEFFSRKITPKPKPRAKPPVRP